MASTDKKIALVTGANKGIGFEIAKQLASHDGYHVLLGSRDPVRGATAAETLQNAGLSVGAITLDVASDASIAAAVQFVQSRFGRLDVLINNAAILQDIRGGPLTRARFEETFAVNTFGAALTTEFFIPLLEQSTSPRLVFVSSDQGSLTLRADPQDHNYDIPAVAYRSSKAAMNMIALGYAARFKEKGWKVNIHNPGFTKTDLNFNRGTGTVEDAAAGAVRFAMSGEDGETATFSQKEGLIPW